MDEGPQLGVRFQVSRIPLLVVMNGGEVVNQSLGVRPKAQILAMLP